MRIAVGSDEPYPVHDVIVADLERRGHEIVRFGSLASGADEPWTEVAEAAARAVATGDCDEGVLCCWTGTGISMAANKLAGIRAALCGDPGTAAGARVWNHANVLCLSNRTLFDRHGPRDPGRLARNRSGRPRRRWRAADERARPAPPEIARPRRRGDLPRACRCDTEPAPVHAPRPCALARRSHVFGV